MVAGDHSEKFGASYGRNMHVGLRLLVVLTLILAGLLPLILTTSSVLMNFSTPPLRFPTTTSRRKSVARPTDQEPAARAPP